ncbi:MAG: hypothetical protein WBD40_18205 [Tepidisphaeraceae bacterium]
MVYSGDGDATQESREYYASGISIADVQGNPNADIANTQVNFDVTGLPAHTHVQVVAHVHYMQLTGDGVDTESMTISVAGSTVSGTVIDEFIGGYFDQIEVSAQHDATSATVTLSTADWETSSGEYYYIDHFEVSVDTTVVTVAAVDGTATEPGAGSSATDLGTFRISRTGMSLAGAVTVNYSMSGAPLNGTDYSTLSGTATIPANLSYVDVTVTPLADSVGGEEDAGITMTIGAGSDYEVGTASSAIVELIQKETIGGTPTTITVGAAASATGISDVTHVAPNSNNAQALSYKIKGSPTGQGAAAVAALAGGSLTLTGQTLLPTNGITNVTFTWTAGTAGAPPANGWNFAVTLECVTDPSLTCTIIITVK